MFLSVFLPLMGMSVYLKEEISESILAEKRDKLFGLARQLDTALEGSFDDLLAEEGALGADRETKIALLNARLRAVTDFVASGNAGVGVGYYCRELDAVITYGPSEQLQYTVGQSIFQGHLGYEVMATGTPMVQTGSLVRGDILNCMWPIIRDEKTIGYIWSNETLDMVSRQLYPIINRIYLIQVLIFFLIYMSLTITMQSLLRKITSIKKGIEVLFNVPNYHIPQVSGELSSIVTTINDLVATTNLVKCYNQSILEGVKNGVLAISCDGLVARANRAFLEMIPDFDKSQLDRSYRDVFWPELVTLIESCLEGRGDISGVELVYNGTILETYGNAMFDETGSRTGAVFVFRDISIMRRYEREIQQKEQAAMLGEMALAVVHEVRNPMTAVKGFAQLLSRPGLGEDKRSRYLVLIDSELNRVNRLLDEMLVYGGKSRLEPRPCDLLVLVREAVERASVGPLGVKPRLVFDAACDCHARLDAFKIRQLLDNVLKNACEAVAAKGRGNVVAIARCAQDALTLLVADSGIGIRPDLLPRIGTPLLSTKKTGNGFGLAISRKIAEAHGGSLSIDSREGVYTVVKIVLPRDRDLEDAER